MEKEAFTLHPAQIRVVKDNHRFQVINAGRRFGKSTLVAWEMFSLAVANDNARVPYYAPTRDDARDIMWKPLKEICGPLIVGEPNESRLEIVVRNKFGTTSLIVLYGWEAVQERGKGVGVKNNHIYFDEVAKYKNFLYGWQEILRPTLIDLKGGATFISTPNGFNHFYDLSLMEGVDPDFKYFHFTSMDNPYLPPEELIKMKSEMTDDRYAQEVLGEFRKKEGLVYKEFSRDIHIVDDLPTIFLEKLGGVDWGHTHPAVVLTVKKDYDGNYFITDEWYHEGRTESEVVDMTVSQKFNKVYPDPSNPAGIEALRKRGVNVREVNKNKGSVMSGIQQVRELLKSNRLKIHRSCAMTIQEFESYSYLEGKGKLPDENPIKEGDDAMDALRYVIMSDLDIGTSYTPKLHYGISTPKGNRINLAKFR
jgi:PBSX family phage terminase large subunit